MTGENTAVLNCKNYPGNIISGVDPIFTGEKEYAAEAM
jgi:hypothetical protein